jgi:predicted MPP superfamily phosphohydrolase
MKPLDFSKRSAFPGTVTSPFDAMVRFGDAVDRLPVLVFVVTLFLLALVPTRLNLPLAFGLWIFCLGDWLLLLALPRFGKSYGPAQPPTLLLAILRVIPAAFFAPPWFWLAQLLGTALVVYAFWIEPHRIRLTRHTLVSPKLSAAPPLRLLHLGDLHIERITAREKQLIAMVKSLAPDVILFSGDFLNLSYVDDPVAWEQCRLVLRELSAPLGVFAVTGSPPVDQPHVIAKVLDGLNIRWLRNEKVTLNHHGQSIDVVGVTCTHRPYIDEPHLLAALNGKPERFTILLYHTPDLAPEAAAAGIDLQLSGHTHGGQVRLPFFGALYTSSLYGKRFEGGRYKIDQMTLYVTRGIGLEGMGAPRVRFLCAPEMTLWEIGGVNRTNA